MISYRRTLTYLYALQLRGMKLGLRNTRQLLRFLGDPHKTFPSIHLAGTNGKGSTSAFLASIMMEAGLRTGLYTSPHLVRFGERIRIDGKELSEERLVSYVRDLRRTIDSIGATFFEATTAIAFRYFADEHIDMGVIETGLGGRFDSTNVLVPVASVITTIGLDHTDVLGDTVEKIAKEKGGIIKPRVPVILGHIHGAPLSVLRDLARARHAPLRLATVSASCIAVERQGALSLRFRTGLLHGVTITPGFGGSFQVDNAQLAIAVATVLKASAPPPLAGLTPKGVGRGILRVKENVGLRGRFEHTSYRGKPYIFDVGHNADGIRALVEALLQAREVPAVIVFGAMADKDVMGMARALAALRAPIVGVVPAMPRALQSLNLLKVLYDAGCIAVDGGSVWEGVQMARNMAGNRPVLVTGSHYVAGEALQGFEGVNP